MADYDRRQGGGGYNPRKRRHREDDDHQQQSYRDQRGPRRRHEPPVPSRLRKQIIDLADNPLRRVQEEVNGVAHLLADNYDDERLRANFVDLVLQLAVEQPLKTPFAAAVVLVVNTLTHKPPTPTAAAAPNGGGDGLDTSMENGGQDGQPATAAEPQPTSGVVDDLLAKAAAQVEEKVRLGEWRAVKLYLKLLACLQSCLEGDGVFPILEDLFNQAVELQTANNEDTIGTELVKIILLTIPYAVAAAPEKTEKLATELLDKTEVIAGEPHALQNLIDPFHPEADEKSPAATMSFMGLLQTQLQAEASSGWKLACLPRPWKMPLEEVEQQEKLDNCPQHKLPAITIPETLIAGPRPLFPEIFFSVYLGQEIESVPPVTSISSSLIRDNLVDTINVLHFNRTVAGRRLIDIDNYFAEGTFVSRATPFDQIRDVPPGKSTWKPEDVVVDAVFSQLFLLPTPEQKLVYYHSVLTEACRIAPAAIAPSFGRAIRFLYRNIGTLDIELGQRFTDWFSHHLSNFGFTWKWTEWTADVKLPNLHPCKAFIMGAIDKEIRLSFAGRIRKTLPEGYQELVPPEKDVEEPPFKFEKDDTPFAQEGRELAQLLKRKASDEDIQPVIERIHSLAIDQGLDPLVASTDVFTTAVLSIGSKSLSHVLAAIERTKDRLMDAGATSEPARAQIISAVMDFWSAHPGVAITIIEKLLNYSIVSPSAVVQWALVRHAGETRGEALARSHIYELVFNTINKVTKRMREVVASSSSVSSNTNAAATGGAEGGQEEGVGEDTNMTSELEDAKKREAQAARELFRTTEDAVVAWASGAKDELMEDAGGLSDPEREERDRFVRRWGDRWLRVVRRRAAIEETFLLEAEKNNTKA